MSYITARVTNPAKSGSKRKHMKKSTKRRANPTLFSTLRKAAGSKSLRKIKRKTNASHPAATRRKRRTNPALTVAPKRKITRRRVLRARRSNPRRHTRRAHPAATYGSLIARTGNPGFALRARRPVTRRRRTERRRNPGIDYKGVALKVAAIYAGSYVYTKASAFIEEQLTKVLGASASATTLGIAKLVLGAAAVLGGEYASRQSWAKGLPVETLADAAAYMLIQSGADSLMGGASTTSGTWLPLGPATGMGATWAQLPSNVGSQMAGSFLPSAPVLNAQMSGSSARSRATC